MCNDECLLLKMNIMQKYLSLPIVPHKDMSGRGKITLLYLSSSCVAVICRLVFSLVNAFRGP